MQYLIVGAKARALLHGRTHVSTDDIQALAKPVLRHRLVVNFAAESEGVTPDDIVGRLLGDHSHQRGRADARCPIPKDFCILRRSPASARLEVRARHVVEGFLAGIHRSPYFGQSIEFLPAPRVRAPATTCGTSTGRSGPSRTAITSSSTKKTRTCAATLLVDVSGSMRYGSGPLNKFDYACTLAVSLAYLLLRQQDAVGCLAFDETVRSRVPLRTKRSHLNSDHPGPGRLASRSQKTDMLAILRGVAETYPRRGMMILISDLLVDRAVAVRRPASCCGSMGHDVMVFHVLDDDELDFPFNGATRFEGLELPDI